MTRGLNAQEQIQRTSDHPDLESGRSRRTVRYVCREHEISDATYYQWKSKYGGMQASDIKRLRELEEERRRLKQISADLLLESGAERCDRKKALRPAAKREPAAALQTEHGLSERCACAAVGLQRLVYHDEPRPNADGPIVKLLLELAWQRPERGFGKLFRRLSRLGHGWNHKRVSRIYCSLKLNKRRKGKRRLPTRCPAPLGVPKAMNEC